MELFINSKEPPALCEELEELTRLKAVPVTSPGSVGFSSHPFVTSSGPLHVKCHREEAKGKEDEQEEEEPKPPGHMVWVDHHNHCLTTCKL